MADTDHLNAIELRMSHELSRVAAAKTPKEKEWREHNVRMIERERDAEIEFLKARGIEIIPVVSMDEIMSDDELLALLTA